MISTLRDENLRNITVSEIALKEIDDKLRVTVLEANNATSDENKKLWISYIIRFDKKGRSFLNFENAMECYKTARNIERFIFTVECYQSFQNRLFGKSVDIRFDGYDINYCRLAVQGDDTNWVDNLYPSLIDIIKKYKNYHFIIRTSTTPFLVQIVGVLLGILLSIKGAHWLSPRLKTEYAIPFSFVIVFLLFSNIWTYLYAALLRGIDKVWPNIIFKEKQNILLIILKWMMNIMLGFIFLAGVKSLFSFFVNVWNSIFQ